MSPEEIAARLTAALEERLARQGRAALAIDGMCGSGKSTLAALLAEALGERAVLVHADDFYLPLALRTPERLAQPGGNLHRERLAAQVLIPWRAGKPLCYGVFDHTRMDVGGTVTVPHRPVLILEGSYSMHPALRGYYDLSAFLRLSPVQQEARILGRNGPEKLLQFRERWIPLENAYFTALQVEAACDFSFDTGTAPEDR